MAKKAKQGASQTIPIEPFLNARRVAEHAHQLKESYARPYQQRQEALHFLMNYIDKEKLKEMDLSKDENLYPLLAEAEKNAIAYLQETFKNDKETIIRGLEPGKLEQVAAQIEPDESQRLNNEAAYDANVRFIALAEIKQMYDASVTKKDKHLKKEVIEKYISMEDAESEREIREELEKRESYKTMSDDKKEIWAKGIRAAYIGAITELYSKSSEIFEHELDKSLERASKRFYESFPEKDRREQVAEYGRRNLLSLAERGDEGFAHAYGIVERLAA